jgi:integrase
VAVIQEHKTSGHGRHRFLVLTALAMDVLRPLVEAGKGGALIRNSKGNPWGKDALGHAMRRLSKAAGVKAIAYGYRHAYATDALASGVADATVAALLGHCDTSMVHRHYSHLSSRTQTLRAAAATVRP